MADTPNPPIEANPRVGREFEDAHYHDEDDVVPLDDSQPRVVRTPVGRKPVRRLPPPKRRFHED